METKSSRADLPLERFLSRVDFLCDTYRGKRVLHLGCSPGQFIRDRMGRTKPGQNPRYCFGWRLRRARQVSRRNAPPAFSVGNPLFKMALVLARSLMAIARLGPNIGETSLAF